MKDVTCRWRITSTSRDYCKVDGVINILFHCCDVLKMFATNDLKTSIIIANTKIKMIKIIKTTRIKIKTKRKIKHRITDDQQRQQQLHILIHLLQQIYNIIYGEC